ncbi:hypothetical protein G3I23_24715, partial [Streptomyces sp. SID10115]
LSEVLVEVESALVELIRRAQRDGGFPEHSPRLVAQLLMIMMQGLLHASPGRGDGGPEAEAVGRLLFAALSAKVTQEAPEEGEVVS